MTIRIYKVWTTRKSTLLHVYLNNHQVLFHFILPEGFRRRLRALSRRHRDASVFVLSFSIEPWFSKRGPGNLRGLRLFSSSVFFVCLFF